MLSCQSVTSEVCKQLKQVPADVLCQPVTKDCSSTSGNDAAPKCLSPMVATMPRCSISCRQLLDIIMGQELLSENTGTVILAQASVH